jgi:hypothetical protein
MKEKLQEIYEGLKERLKSPFLLTFMFVWIIHNWEFVYALVAFGNDIPFINRFLFLKKYITDHHNNELLWFPILWTFVSIGLYFIATFFSEGINLIYSKWIRTWLYLIIDHNKLKTEDDYNELEERRKNLQELVFDLKRKEEDAALKLRSRENALNEDISNLRDSLSKILSEKNEAIKSNEENIIIQSKQKEIISKIEKQLEYAMSEASKWEITATGLKEFKDWVSDTLPELIDDYNNRIYFNSNSSNKLNSDRKRFEELFSGTWINTFVGSGGVKGIEQFNLGIHNEQLAFVTNDGSIMIISNIKFIDDSNLSFVKTNIKNPTRPMKNKLRIINSSSLDGTENETIKIKYSRKTMMKN